MIDNPNSLIDISFDFTTDTPGYWDGYWERRNGLGAGTLDPDRYSPTLKAYHKKLWKKILPNGEYMNLTDGEGNTYLQWDGFRLASDTIIIEMKYEKYRNIIEQVMGIVGNYKSY